MNANARKEILVVVVLIIILLVGVFFATLHARREVRDGVRRTEVRNIKHTLEMYFNEHETYPLSFNDAVHEYVVVEQDEKGATGWYVRAELENKAEPTSAFDLEYNIEYRIILEGGRTFYDLCGGNLKCE
jgi:type II secretory pathway pseudopilin PulG